MAKFDKSVLEKYGITGTTEVLYNPSYEVLFNEETKEGLEGFEVGQETELGAIKVSTQVVLLRTSSSLTMRLLTIQYGGTLKNTTTTTIVQLKKHGLLLRKSQRKNFPTSVCSWLMVSAVHTKTPA